MKKLLKITLISTVALFMLVGCGFSPAASTENLSSIPSSSAGIVLTAVQSDSASDAAVSSCDASGEYDASEAVALLPEGDLTITEAGVYILTGDYEGMIVVEVGKEDKVQLVLENAALTNGSGPAIYVRSADKVFITAAAGTVNTISDGSDYVLTDGDTTVDAAVFSKDDLTVNGAGKLTIRGNCKHAVVSKDDLVITAKDLTVSASNVGLSGKDSVTLSEAAVSITAGSDGIRSENGSVLISDGEYTIQSRDDGIHANEKAEISAGTLNITACEGIEGTYILISGGDISIQASDDGINAARKSSTGTPTVEISGGSVSVTMGAGDTDAIDSNGDIIITGGTVRVNGSSGFDYDGSATFTGGTVYVNGQQVSSIPNQFMGGGMGGFGGGPGGQGGFGGGRGHP